MADHPCVVDPTLTECVELAEKLASTGSASLTDVLKSNAPAVMERLNAAIAHIGEWVETGEAFASEQVPLLVTEIIYWGAAAEAFWVMLGVFFLVLGGLAARLAIKKWAAWGDLSSDTNDFLKTTSCIVAIAGSVMGFFFVACNIMDMLKPLVAPRLYLIEYFQHLVR